MDLLVKIRKKVILFFWNYLPLQIWTLKICIHDFSKTIIARSFKLGQLMMSRLIGENLRKKVILFL